ncbi:YitT family protein [Tessaracoccus sp. OH4464_COT-324]|uniref:YczE/YyaS/YitT family protein n=1 Tax=Tessaracoccus sp. OH4464_COT-324 TaxID=2491059 RepID=UPI001319F0CC|nr:DUF6198 family protein [Tessaracoccus sp. OH4464_COT-324]
MRLTNAIALTVLGLTVMALGNALIVLSDLGAPPTSAPVWVASLAGWGTFGTWMLIINMIFLAAQMVILRRKFQTRAWLQLPASLIFSVAIDVWVPLTRRIQLTGYAAEWAQLLVGTLILGVGIALMVLPKLVYLPGEGLAAAITEVTRFTFGPVRVALDVFLVALAVVISLWLFGEVRGVREGTLAAALLVGSIAGLVLRLLGRLRGVGGRSGGR